MSIIFLLGLLLGIIIGMSSGILVSLTYIEKYEQEIINKMKGE